LLSILGPNTSGCLHPAFQSMPCDVLSEIGRLDRRQELRNALIPQRYRKLE
jgi:hypothetical protein